MLPIGDMQTVDDALNQVVCGDAADFVRKLPAESADIVVTSPPYWQQRDYGVEGQYGLEESMPEYIDRMFHFFEDVKRVLKPKGTLWVNVGDCYNENSGGYFAHKNNDAPHIGKHRLKTKKYDKLYPRRSLLMIPYRLAIKMIDDGGWTCRNMIVWRKKIVQPTTAQNRFTIDYEPMFLFAKTNRYFYKKERVKWIVEEVDDMFSEPSKRERRAVWDLDSDHHGGTGHKAPYPIDLAEIPILGGTDEGGVVLDPFVGSGSTICAAKKLGRNFLSCDLSPEFCEMAENRLRLVTV
tara:strand:+ start:287328 stop:288209 length:882 start_codon:yes stop_codon:yes gene_type:complete